MTTRMRLVFLAVGFAAWGCAAQDLHEIRIVNGKPVDVGPLLQWFADQKGERPLKHWKRIQIWETKGKVGGWDHCKVKTEAGLMVELYVANLPADIRPFFAGLRQQTTAIANLKAQIAADEQREKALWNRYVDTPSEFSAVTSTTKGTAVDTEETRRTEARATSERLRAQRKQLAALEANYDETVKQSAEKLTTFAMFSGRKYGGLEIWDCGEKQR